MPEIQLDQDALNWKQKYYDNLDQLDKKQSSWHTLESVLKKAVLRLSIAAEGQNSTIDGHIHDIRGMVKKEINVIRLDNTLDDISNVLKKIEDSKIAVDKKVVTMLAHMLENIELPDSAQPKKNKLIKKLSNATDKDSERLVSEVEKFFSATMIQNPGHNKEDAKTGFLSNLFPSKNKITVDKKTNDISHDVASQYVPIIKAITLMAKSLPWPKELKSNVEIVLNKLAFSKKNEIENHLNKLISLADKWSQSQDLNVSDKNATDREVTVKENKDSLTLISNHKNTKNNNPSSREVLLSLLEQLTIPKTLHTEFSGIKQRLTEELFATDWKQLIKDIAKLINTLQNLMQEEKLEFENFLQQMTSRLQEIDGFLLSENTSLIEAEQASDTFDSVVCAQVDDIHNEIKTAKDLHDLKGKVEQRLNVVSEHIKEYRVIEERRFKHSQQNVEDMKSRLVHLEQESIDLKKLMIEKNKEAMFDVLTKIPNRLAYEKRVIEEIARCKRYSSSLSMAVWDIDFFKKVNDTYGHKIGDKILMAVAQILEERKRETDFVARYGGEEFVMFLPETNEDEALVLVDAVRKKISSYRFNDEEIVIKVTVSCGISHFITDDTHERMFDRADKALYAAKNQGRNQCVTHTSSHE